MTFPTGYAVPQTIPPRPPSETLPSMYDLPSECAEEPGLPDEYHDLQPQLLSRTLRLIDYPREQWFTASDLNLYYDVHHPLWYKRPDWFLATSVPRLYGGQDLRRSYVTWQEGRSPAVVIEFLSPGTESEDLGPFAPGKIGRSADHPMLFPQQGQNPRAQDPSFPENKFPENKSLENDLPANHPPAKFVVYEQYLRVPHYLVYDRKSEQLRYFQLVGQRYEEQPVAAHPPSLWLADLHIGLGRWEGNFDGVEGCWLRWCHQNGDWCLTDTEQEQQAKEQVQAQVIQAAQNLLATGMPLKQVVEILGLSTEQQQQL